jgi:hypothetical protein
MSTVDEIVAAIEKLSLSERGEVERRLHGWVDDEWDQQMVRDIQSGKLDGLLKEVRADIDAGRLEEGP